METDIETVWEEVISTMRLKGFRDITCDQWIYEFSPSDTLEVQFWRHSADDQNWCMVTFEKGYEYFCVHPTKFLKALEHFKA